MTNKEAIKILKNYHNGYFGYKIDDVKKAHNLAIKALGERPQGKCAKWKCYECYKRTKETGALLFCEAVGKCKFEKGGAE